MSKSRQTFDRGLITFDADGKIIISKKLNRYDRDKLNINKAQRIEIVEGMEPFMKYHRENIFKKTK